MKIVKVTYTVKAEFAKKNQENVNEFITDLRNIKDSGIRYSSYLAEDGKTFTHISIHKNEAAQQNLFNLESFKSFQKERDQRLEIEPHIEFLELVSSSFDIFN
ncbi:hypothetical protein [Pedobacter panaciterrae]|jgi:hypothetical protein|uniref:hypothetical protein n=1 Tax=Pedobacter panaciterrae TaxID=363849 RepID=UPI00155D8F78|nr:hypothetical protein [Pedobacter panaciterrae]NQX54154.1 hypothetical protein [Pedobacter panaciterrae]